MCSVDHFDSNFRSNSIQLYIKTLFLNQILNFKKKSLPVSNSRTKSFIFQFKLEFYFQKIKLILECFQTLKNQLNSIQNIVMRKLISPWLARQLNFFIKINFTNVISKRKSLSTNFQQKQLNQWFCIVIWRNQLPENSYLSKRRDLSKNKDSRAIWTVGAQWL